MTYDVYLGTDETAVTNADNTDTTGIFRRNQGDTFYDPRQLEWNTEHFWRVDMWDGNDLTAGDVWSFTTIAQDMKEGAKYWGQRLRRRGGLER
jgi:hypothetical protein